MADDPELPPPSGSIPPLNQLVDQLVDQSFSIPRLGRIERLIGNAIQWALVNVIGVVLSLGAKIGVFFASSLAEAENQSQKDFDRLAAVAIKDMFGVDVPALSATRGTGGNTAAADAVGEALFRAFEGQARGAGVGEGGLQPTDAPAKSFLSSMAQLALEGWLEGWVTEALTLGQLETFGDLDDTISHVLGLGRASAAVHGPLVKHMIVTPLEWKLRKEHRPELLSASQVARQFARGKWDWPDVVEELARQGFSEERIDAIINEQRRFISLEDVATLAHRIDRATFDPEAYLADMGWQPADARAVLLARATRQLEQQEKQLADAYLAAFVAGDIDAGRFHAGIDGIAMPPEETAHYHKLGDLRTSLAAQPLSDSDARAAVKEGITTFAWYRGFLRERGFVQEAIDIKELLLRKEINAAADAAKLRAEQSAERAADQAAADAARARRVEAQAIAAALPAYGEVRRAFVRGLVPRERLELAIATTHPGITPADAAALVADAELDRAQYLEAQAAHAAALAGDADKALPLATLEASVLRGVTSLDAYDRELVRRGYSEENRRILVELLRGRLADQTAAAAAKAKAAARAQLAGVSLADFTRAVRLGLRTPAQLETLLRQLETPDVERALILDLLQSDLTRDDAARTARAQADAAAAARAINLPLRRRAVLKGIRTIEQYAQDLADAGVALEARELELDLLSVELDDAEAARARAAELEAQRADREREQLEPTLTIAQTERAVKLGLLTPDDLRERLAALNYAPDDIETLIAIVVADIPDTRAAQRLNADAIGAVARKGLDLPALERAVLRGLRSLDDYRAALEEKGYGPDDRELLAQLLAEKLALDLDGLRKKVDTALETLENGPTRAELELAATDGSVDAGTLQRFLAGAGVARDVAIVYLRLLASFGLDPDQGGPP